MRKVAVTFHVLRTFTSIRKHNATWWVLLPVELTTTKTYALAQRSKGHNPGKDDDIFQIKSRIEESNKTLLKFERFMINHHGTSKIRRIILTASALTYMDSISEHIFVQLFRICWLAVFLLGNRLIFFYSFFRYFVLSSLNSGLYD